MMRKTWFKGFILGFLVLNVLVSCRKESSFVRQEQRDGYTVTIFDIPEMQENKEPLKFSELVENARVIPLETPEKCLIGNRAKYYIGNDCILVFQDEFIALFDSQGHFKRIIARNGKGPQEYQRVRDYSVDEKNKMLFILDNYAVGSLKNYHLEDSAYFKEIKTIETIQHNAVALLENGDFLLVPYPCEKVSYIYYQQTPDGELGANIPCHSDRKGIFMSSEQLMYRVGNDFRYLSSGQTFSDDTVFNITARGPLPMWIFNCNPAKNYRVIGETPEFLFFALDIVTKKHKEQTEGGVSEYIESRRQYFSYNKKNGELGGIKGILDDCFSGKEWSLYHTCVQSGNRFYIAATPTMLLPQADKKPVPGVQVKYPEIWDGILSNLKEDDNPVLIIGDLK